MTSNSFPKTERLHGQKDIAQLFDKGHSLFLYPFKLFFLKPNDQRTSRFLVTVPIRNFKKATHRNLIKRRVREAYRLNEFRQRVNIYDLGFVYIAKEIVPYTIISEKLNALLKRLENQK